MKVRVQRRRALAGVLTAAFVVAALPLIGAPPSGAVPASDTCAGMISGGISNPDSALPQASYINVAPVIKGQDKIVNNVANSAPKGVRFSANLTLAGAPAYAALLAPDPGVGTGTLKVTWKNGAVKTPKLGDSASPYNGIDAEYKAPTIEFSESQKENLLIPRKLVLAKGVATGVPAEASSVTNIANLAPGDIVRTIGQGPVSNSDIIAGAFTVAYKATLIPNQQTLFAVWPYDAADMVGQAAFVTFGNTLLAAFDPNYVDVDPTTDDDAACTMLGFAYVACVYDTGLIPGLEESTLCDTIV
jgi:hypothetical protein